MRATSLTPVATMHAGRWPGPRVFEQIWPALPTDPALAVTAEALAAQTGRPLRQIRFQLWRHGADGIRQLAGRPTRYYRPTAGDPGADMDRARYHAERASPARQRRYEAVLADARAVFRATVDRRAMPAWLPPDHSHEEDI